MGIIQTEPFFWVMSDRLISQQWSPQFTYSLHMIVSLRSFCPILLFMAYIAELCSLWSSWICFSYQCLKINPQTYIFIHIHCMVFNTHFICTGVTSHSLNGTILHTLKTCILTTYLWNYLWNSTPIWHLGVIDHEIWLLSMSFKYFFDRLWNMKIIHVVRIIFLSLLSVLEKERQDAPDEPASVLFWSHQRWSLYVLKFWYHN